MSTLGMTARIGVVVAMSRSCSGARTAESLASSAKPTPRPSASANKRAPRPSRGRFGDIACCGTLALSTRSKRIYARPFFFSSRRRHTRYIGDWSSDVCSSDLAAAQLAVLVLEALQTQGVLDGQQELVG